MKWKEYRVVTGVDCAEAVAGIFHRLGSGGVVIEDPREMIAQQDKKLECWNNPVSSPWPVVLIIKAYFPEDKDIMEELNLSLRRVESHFQSRCITRVEEVQDEDWEQSWKKYYRPLKISERLIVKPSWEEYQAGEHEVLIDLDPGMAFGTGLHPSTQFCLRFLERYIQGGEQVIDAGTGSGILAIAAAKLGAAQVLAIDIDDLAVKVSQENVALNGLSAKIKVEQGDIKEAFRGRKADLILANILAEVIVELIPEASTAIVSGGLLFASGIIANAWPAVEEQLKLFGWAVEQLIQEGDWIGVAARKQ